MSKSTGTKMYRKPPPGIMPHSRQIYGRKKGSDLPYERRFLNALRSGLTVTRACIQAGVAFSTVHSWRTHYPEFKARWDEAMERGTDALEDVAVDRAIAGSDTLLMFLLRARRPEKYRRAADLNINQQNAVFLTPKQTAERLRLLGLSPLLLEMDTGDVNEGAAGTAVDADPRR
jgi:transposase-like protein